MPPFHQGHLLKPVSVRWTTTYRNLTPKLDAAERVDGSANTVALARAVDPPVRVPAVSSRPSHRTAP
jgi:hypothetical protein